IPPRGGPASLGANAPAAQVRGAYVGGLRGRHRGAAPALAALDIEGAQSVVGQFALESSWPVMLSPPSRWRRR
ncbi:hypothetical protein, partial [[Kitasatospora] papulosa]|uniref:hypothetical protein n=1 Tax=[Kitasatospora] papulosa TaxID=1464011 RepID=UPI0036C2D17E